MPTKPAPPPLRPLAIVAYLAGISGMTAALTLVFLGMRSVMDVGGSCAEGGAYVIETHCPDGATPALFLGIWGGLAFVGLTLWGGSQLGRGFASVVILGWPALFGTLGFNFLQFAFDPRVGGVEIGWLLCGVMFEAMALPVLFSWLVGIRLSLRPGGGREDRPERPASPFHPPIRYVEANESRMERQLAVLDAGLKAALAKRVATETLAAGEVAAAAAGTSDGAAAAAEIEGLVDGLDRLARLYREGSLTDVEYAAAKARLLEAADR